MLNRLADARISDWLVVFIILFLFALTIMSLMSLLFRDEVSRNRISLPAKEGWHDTPNSTSLLLESYENP